MKFLAWVVVILIALFILGNYLPGTKEKPEKHYYYVARHTIEKNLKAPASATWSNYIDDPEAWCRHLGNHVYEAHGWVDSINGFNAKLRSKWRMVMAPGSGKTVRILYVKFDDHEEGDYEAAMQLAAYREEASTPTPAPAPEVAAVTPPASTPQTTLTLTKPVQMSSAYGQITLQPGTRVRVLSRSGALIRIAHGADTADIPLASTDAAR